MPLGPDGTLGSYTVTPAIGEDGTAFAERGVPPQRRRVLRSHERTAR